MNPVCKRRISGNRLYCFLSGDQQNFVSFTLASFSQRHCRMFFSKIHFMVFLRQVIKGLMITGLKTDEEMIVLSCCLLLIKWRPRAFARSRIVPHICVC